MKTKKALLVIDMQKGSFTPKTPRFDTSGVVNRINGLADLFRRMGFPVIFIQHDGNGTGEFEKDTWEWELLDELQTEKTDIRLDKYVNDVFYESGLHRRLMDSNVGELLITGCATDFCVESTIQSALTKDFDITVVSDGHTTGERPHLRAEKVIEHYNWVWQNMIPTNGKIKVESYDGIIKTFANNLYS
ncbi:isochorismatase family protein [Flagellimonas allohymeniacidonis]|uniref:Isochorismatase family protein n=1 Tax=Flagellimonas allohymeniacidonis TaxID=2517819 RepID=A0A4V2HSM8_9FLAO|nr:isochorismatase family protein [Allomuricauda hymeniacidonis]TAI48390.1 isochorismatase family protein [Allomuricauda hymeniacidonis]